MSSDNFDAFVSAIDASPEYNDFYMNLMSLEEDMIVVEKDRLVIGSEKFLNIVIG